MEKIEKKIYDLKKDLTELRIAKTNLEMQMQEMEDEVCSQTGRDVDMYIYYAKLDKVKKLTKEILKKEAVLEKLEKKAKKKKSR